MVGFANMDTYIMLQNSHDDLLDKAYWYFECLDTVIAIVSDLNNDANKELGNTLDNAERELRSMIK